MKGRSKSYNWFYGGEDTFLGNKTVFLWYLRDRNSNPSLAAIGPSTFFTGKIITTFNGCHCFGD